MLFNDARLWTVKFSYTRYTRKLDVIVNAQVKAERKFPGANEAEARRAARDWVNDEFVREYLEVYGRRIANIKEGQSLTRYDSCNITSAVPY